MHEKVCREKYRLYAGTVLHGCGALAFGLAALTPSPVSANPQGGIVRAGAATIQGQGTSALQVNQVSDRAVIDWKSFDIAPGETTIFHQPSASSAILNRIHNQNPSQIFGQLSANGIVALVNPNGMVFGKDSRVDVGSLIATTADIRNGNFMAGRMDFTLPGTSAASVVNEGRITAQEAGLVGLVAPNVANHGTITARLGTVALASGDQVTMDLYGDGLVAVAVGDRTASRLVENRGHIAAEGGSVALTAAAAREVVDSLIVNTGVIEATALGEHQGTISLYAEGSNAVVGNKAGEKGKKQGSSTVLVQGVLDASGRNPGEHGGTVTVTGDRVGILSGALIDASGDQGGGAVHIGGQRQGQGDTPASRQTYVDAHSLIVTDALTRDNGGETIVWSDGDTSFYGIISGRGGAQGGNGGFAETSGHHNLTADGYVLRLANIRHKACKQQLRRAHIPRQ
jgi:filamentous hemagglutinin family protein